MLTAVLSDIHGNLEALEAVREDLQSFAVSRVVCLGDMIGYGPDPEEVLIQVRTHGALCCMGNHELGASSRAERHWFNATAQKGLDLTRNLLSPDSLAFIAALPRSLVVDGARFVHGFPPESVTSYLFEQTDAAILNWFAQGEGLTFVGHTHELIKVALVDGRPERRELGQETTTVSGPTIINAGSVGQPRDGDNRAKYLLWDSQAGTVSVRFVRYDIARTVDKIRRRGFPEYYGTRLW